MLFLRQLCSSADVLSSSMLQSYSPTLRSSAHLFRPASWVLASWICKRAPSGGRLKLMYPQAPEITYELRDMHQWLDQLVCCMTAAVALSEVLLVFADVLSARSQRPVPSRAPPGELLKLAP